MGKKELPLLPDPEMSKDNKPKGSLLQEGQAEKHEGLRFAKEASSQGLPLAEKQAMKWFSGLGKDAQQLNGGQSLDLPQADLRSAISAYASLPSVRSNLAQQ